MSAATARLFRVQVSAHLQILAHGEIREDAASFGRHRDAARDEFVRRLAADVFVFESDFAGAWFEQAGDRAQRGGFAGAIRADQRDYFTLLDVQRNAGQRLDGAIVNGNVFERKH